MNDARESSLRLADLLHREHCSMADFLIALADFDRRRLWLRLGHSSLFYFLHRELRLSKGAAYYRKVAADLIQRFPDVIEPLRAGKLCITSVGELAPGDDPGKSSRGAAPVLPPVEAGGEGGGDGDEPGCGGSAKGGGDQGAPPNRGSTG
jgi:hypothetical protein